MATSGGRPILAASFLTSSFLAGWVALSVILTRVIGMIVPWVALKSTGVWAGFPSPASVSTPVG